MTIYSDVTNLITPGPKTADGLHQLRRDVARYRGAVHPLCFTDEVMDHEFPEGFKPVNIESYDGTIDPRGMDRRLPPPHPHGPR